MEFNVAQLLKEPVGGVRKYEISDNLDDLDPGLVIQAPITGQVKFTKILGGILVTGRLQTVVEVQCARCLEPFDLPIAIELEEEFRATTDLATGASLPVGDAEDEATLIDEKNIIDLSEVVRQALILALPATPICRDGDCKGLCDQCGKNLNEGACDCVDDDIDPRWEALRQLLPSDADETNEE